MDGSVKLWSMDSDEPIADIEGHTSRVSRLIDVFYEIHNLNRFVVDLIVIFMNCILLWYVSIPQYVFDSIRHH